MIVKQMELLFVEKSTGFEALGLFSQVFLQCECKYPNIHSEDQGLGEFDNSENLNCNLQEDDLEPMVQLAHVEPMKMGYNAEVDIMKSMGLPLSFGKQQLKIASVKGKSKRKKKAKMKQIDGPANTPVRIINSYNANTIHDKLQISCCTQSTENVIIDVSLGSSLSCALQNIICSSEVSENILLFLLAKKFQLPPFKLRLIPDIDICLDSFIDEKLFDSLHYLQRTINLCYDNWESRTLFINSFCAKHAVSLTHKEYKIFNEEQTEIFIEDEFNRFWSEHGSSIVLKSWTSKYADYMDNSNTHGSESVSNSGVNNELVNTVESSGLEHSENDEYANLWQDLWNQHWQATMEEERETFFKAQVKCCAKENNDNPKETQPESTNVSTKTSSDVTIVQNRPVVKGHDRQSNDEDSDPPEEIFRKKKRGHEDDVEENADFNFQFKKAGFAVETSVEDGPVPVKLLNFSKLKKIRDCQKSSHSFMGDDCYSVNDGNIIDSTEPINPETSVSFNPKKKNKKKKKDLPEEMILQPELRKYWAQRYRLFSKYDLGIKLDAESWYSVTPERISKHIARRCQSDYLIDAFCGAGGNTIQFALTCQHVLAIDIDPKKIELARHNAAVYGVSNRIEFVVGDFMQLGKHLRADVVFVSMPWGGPEYLNEEIYDLNNTTPNSFEIMEICQKITQNVVLFVPRNSNNNQLVKMAGQGNKVEIEQNILDKKLKTITAYYGSLVHNND